MIASACYGIAVNIIKYYLHDIKPAQITSLSFLLIGPPVAIYLFSTTDFITTASTKPDALWGVFYLSILGIVGTAIAVIIFNRLIKETTAVFASSVTYLIHPNVPHSLTPDDHRDVSFAAFNAKATLGMLAIETF